MERAQVNRRLRAPQKDGQTLVEPPRSLLAEVVARNRQHLAAIDYDIQGRSLGGLAASARRGLIEAAESYTRRYRNVPSDLSSAGPVLLSGHQPQLFHPGVWYKNFVLGDAARELGGVGVHLLIDSDLCRTASIRVPSGSSDAPRTELVEYDQYAAEVPYEERSIRDRPTFESFAARVEAAIEPLVQKPIAHDLWQLIGERGSKESNLGQCLALGRHALEETWNVDTLELPQSAVCSLPEFAWFTAHLFAHLPRLWEAHNEALASYRRAHHLRNRAQPVPDLAETDGWLEAPFWLWSEDDPRRRPVFAQQQGDELVLTDRERQSIALELSVDGDATIAAEQLAGLADRGIKLRTRALATTLFARLVLGDLFFHGIGGAKYDQVTDELAERFFGSSLPSFATVSATLRLPIAHAAIDARLPREMKRQLRDLDFHPELSLAHRGVSDDARPRVEAIVAEKSRWIETGKTPANAYQRHQSIVAANEALQPFVESQREELGEELAKVERQIRYAAILESREYSFCLFPQERLQTLLLDAAARRP